MCDFQEKNSTKFIHHSKQINTLSILYIIVKELQTIHNRHRDFIIIIIIF